MVNKFFNSNIKLELNFENRKKEVKKSNIGC